MMNPSAYPQKETQKFKRHQDKQKVFSRTAENISAT